MSAQGLCRVVAECQWNPGDNKLGGVEGDREDSRSYEAGDHKHL